MHLGHRERLRMRFMKSAIRSLPDYEILEMILFNSFKRKDTKELAKLLLSRFGSLIGVINAEPARLLKIDGVGQSTVFQFKLLQDLFTRLHLPIEKDEVHVFNNWLSVVNYCTLVLGFKTKENFCVLFLNKKNVLIEEEFIEHGTVDKVAVYPREIVKLTVNYGAFAVILVYNHPSGELKPSEEDLLMTKKISEALMSINVALHDHLIIAKNDYYSFKHNNLL